MEFCGGNHSSPSTQCGQENLIVFLCPFQWGGKTSDGITEAINLNKRNIPDMGKQPLTSVKSQNATNLSNAPRKFFLQLPLLPCTLMANNFPILGSAMSWEFCGPLSTAPRSQAPQDGTSKVQGLISACTAHPNS